MSADPIAALRSSRVALAAERDTVLRMLRVLLSVSGDHMSACGRTMGDSHPCTCHADEFREMLKGMYNPDAMSEPSTPV